MNQSTPRAPLSTLGPNLPSSPSSSSADTPARKLAPIFLRQAQKSRRSLPLSAYSAHDEDQERAGEPSRLKRARLSSPTLPFPGCRSGVDENAPPSSESATLGSEGLEAIRKHERVPSIPNYFVTTQLRVGGSGTGIKEPDARRIEMDVDEKGTVWKRRRGRLGLGSRRMDTLISLDRPTFGITQTPYLHTLVHHTSSLSPNLTPSVVFLPSLHPPTGHVREYAPPISLSFNSVAKTYSALEASGSTQRRLLAVAGEEGGVKMLNVDQAAGMHDSENGSWFRAHANAIFDLVWSGDDSRLLTASGDQTSRVHALDGASPRLVATLKGHTSTVKTITFFDPSRSASADAHTERSSVIASAGRDGNILIYDLRCQGRHLREDSDLSEPRRRGEPARYGDGTPGFVPSSEGDIYDPVLLIKGAHGDGTRRSVQRTATRSVTSLVALQAMPGVLASGGSSDGVVKLWDLRFAEGTSRSGRNRSSGTPLGALADPTVAVPGSRRARSVNALVESPLTGDLYALCGDSKIHTLRPSAYSSDALLPEYVAPTFPGGSWRGIDESVQPAVYTDPHLLINSFYVRLALSPDGKYLSSGSARGGLMCWRVNEHGGGSSEAVRLKIGLGGTSWMPKDREISGVDWGKDTLAACADDWATRIWRADGDKAREVREDPKGKGEGWLGHF